MKVLGYIWASPVTFFGLMYVLLFWLFGWYRWKRFHDVSMVWEWNETITPKFLQKMWGTFVGHAIGNVVVVKGTYDRIEPAIVHENEHVWQCMRLGIFQPIMYFLNLITIWLGCRNSNHYYSNPFEIDARRGAGQLIDVEGELKKSK